MKNFLSNFWSSGPPQVACKKCTHNKQYLVPLVFLDIWICVQGEMRENRAFLSLRPISNNSVNFSHRKTTTPPPPQSSIEELFDPYIKFLMGWIPGTDPLFQKGGGGRGRGLMVEILSRVYKVGCVNFPSPAARPAADASFFLPFFILQKF